MSPKTTTVTLALALALALTVTFATANGGCKESLPDILESYDLPPTLFPESAEKSFTCTPLNDSTVLVRFTLPSECKVTRTAFVVKNVLTCAPEVSATVSYRQISNIKGITVTLYISISVPFFNFDFPFPFFPDIMTVTDAKVFYDKDEVKKLQFMAKEGNSPSFPVKDFPKHPPTCDSRHAILGTYFFAANDDTSTPISNNNFPLHVAA